MPENGSGNDIDHLQISIEADAGKAASGIDRLATALGKLRDASSGADYSSLRGLSDSLKTLSGLKLSGVGSTLNAITKLAKEVHALEGLRDIDPAVFTNLAEGLKALSGIKMSGIGTVLAEVRKLPQTLAGLKEIDLNEYVGKIQEIVNVLEPLAVRAMEIVTAFKAISKTNIKVNIKEATGTQASKETEKATFDYSRLGRVLGTLAKPFNKAAAAAGNFLKRLGSRVIHAFTGRIERLATGVHRLFNSIRRVVLMRAIRAVLREITAGFKEGIDNLYQWSALVDGRFKASMDKIATSMLYMKNSLAAMVSPIINKLAPAIDWLVDRFVDLLNIVNQVFSALTGSDTWTKAIKYPVEYAEGMADAAKSTKEAAKELKLFLLPFDELNVLTKDNPADTSTPGSAGQGGLNYAEMFETRELEDWAKKIKDLIDQGDWYGAGAALANHLWDIMESWDTEKWGKELAAKLNNAINFALGFLQTFPFEGAGEKLGAFLNGFVQDFNWYNFGALLAEKTNSISAFLKGMFKKFNGHDFGVALGTMFNGWVETMNVQDIIDAFELGVEDATQIISSFFDTVDVDELAQKIADLLTGCDWENIMSQVWEVAKKAIGTTWKLGATLVENLWNGYETDENGNKVSNPQKAARGKGIVIGGGILGAGALSAGVIGKILGVVGKALPFLSKLFSGSGSGALSGILKVLGPAEGAVVGKGTILTQGLLSSPLSALGALIAPALPYVGTAAGVGMFAAGQASAAKNGTSVGNVLARMYGGAAAGASAGSVAGPLGALVGTGIGLTAGIETSAITAVVEFVTKNWDKIKEAAQPVIDWITTAWGDMTDWISEKWTLVSDWLSEKWTAISTWVDENVIQPVKAVIDPIVEWISTAFEGAWIIVKAAWIIASEWFDEKVIQPIVKLYTDIKEKIVSFFTEAWTRVKAVWAVVSEWFDNKVIQPVIKLYNNVKEKVVGFFTEAWSRVKSTWNVAYQWFNNTIVAPIRRVFEYLGEKIREAFGYSWNMVKLEARQVVNALLGFVESGINSIVHVVNQLIGLFNNVVYAAAKVTGDSWTGLTYWQEVHLGRVDWGDENYAAASRGIGGNNEGFGGLADSLRGALFGDDGNSTQNVNVYLDGEQIANNSVKHINRSTVQNGKSPLLA